MISTNEEIMQAMAMVNRSNLSPNTQAILLKEVQEKAPKCGATSLVKSGIVELTTPTA